MSVYPLLLRSMSKVLNFGMQFKIPGWTVMRLFFYDNHLISGALQCHWISVARQRVLIIIVSALSVILSAVHSTFVSEFVIIPKVSSTQHLHIWEIWRCQRVG